MAQDNVKDDLNGSDLDDLDLSLDEDDQDEEVDECVDQKKKSNKKKWHGQEEYLNALHGCLTISKSKISKISKLSMKSIHRYKDIVHHIEKFIRKGKTENNTKLPQLYIIDSICRADLKENSAKPSRSKFIRRFGKNIDKTFHALCRGPQSDKSSIKRIFLMWSKEKWFDEKRMKAILHIIKGFQIDKEKERSHKKHSSSSHSKRKHKKKEKRKKGLLKSLQSLTGENGEDEEESDDANDRSSQSHNLKRKLMDDDGRSAKRVKREIVPPHPQQNGINPYNTTHQSLPPPQRQVQPPMATAATQPHQTTATVTQPNHSQMQMYQPLAHTQNPQSMQPRQVQSAPAPMMNAYNLPPHGPGAHYQPMPHPSYHQLSHHQQLPPVPGGIGWEVSENQNNVLPDRHRVYSCTIYVGFWNDVHVDIEKLREEGGVFGPVLKIMPHPTKPPHKHAFVQFGSRAIAEAAKAGLRKRFNQLQFVQKVGWGRPPKLIKETFKFDTGIGEVLRVEAPHIAGMINKADHSGTTNNGIHNNNRSYSNVNSNTTQQPLQAPYAQPVYGQQQYHQPQYAQTYRQQAPPPTYNQAPYNPQI